MSKYDAETSRKVIEKIEATLAPIAQVYNRKSWEVDLRFVVKYIVSNESSSEDRDRARDLPVRYLDALREAVPYYVRACIDLAAQLRQVEALKDHD